MVKIDTRIWDNKERMQERIRNMASLILSLCAMNSYVCISSRNWWILGINGLFFLLTLPVFISWVKYNKDPPRAEV